MSNQVTLIPAADSAVALQHFQEQFQFETDCWDTNEALAQEKPGFVVLDVRSKAMFDAGHLPKAIHLPHGKIVRSKMSAWPEDTLFVTYCAGPHCNGATKAAVNLAKLSLKVKLMVGGVTGWVDEGFELIIETAS